MRRKINISKKFLKKEYINNKNSINQIANELYYSNNTVYRSLKEYNIKIRTISEIRKFFVGKQACNFKHGKYCKNRKHYCKDCGKKVTKEAKRCLACEMKYKWDAGIINWTGKKRPNQSKRMAINNPMKGKTGNKHPNWIENKIRFYPLGWTKTFKEQIRYRDHYKCQICGCPEIENGRRLDVYHIDYDKENLDVNNLISLCHSCHMKTNTNRDYWTNYFNIQKGIKC